MNNYDPKKDKPEITPRPDPAPVIVPQPPEIIPQPETHPPQPFPEVNPMPVIPEIKPNRESKGPQFSGFGIRG